MGKKKPVRMLARGMPREMDLRFHRVRIEPHHTGHDVMERSLPRGRGSAGEREARFLLKNTHLIPEWAADFVLVFTLSIRQGPYGHLSLLRLRKVKGKWQPGWCWIGHRWYKKTSLVTVKMSA